MNFIANTLGLLQFCTKPLKCYCSNTLSEKDKNNWLWNILIQGTRGECCHTIQYPKTDWYLYSKVSNVLKVTRQYDHLKRFCDRFHKNIWWWQLTHYSHTHISLINKDLLYVYILFMLCIQKHCMYVYKICGTSTPAVKQGNMVQVDHFDTLLRLIVVADFIS